MGLDAFVDRVNEALRAGAMEVRVTLTSTGVFEAWSAGEEPVRFAQRITMGDV